MRGLREVRDVRDVMDVRGLRDVRSDKSQGLCLIWLMVESEYFGNLILEVWLEASR